MKTPFNYFSLLLILIFTALFTSCQQDALLDTDLLRNPKNTLTERSLLDYTIYSILDVQKQVVSHHPELSKDISGETNLSFGEIGQENVIQKDVYLTGSGDAWSTELGRMRISLNIVYDIYRKTTTGKVSYIFEDGQEMIIGLRSKDPMQKIPMFDGPHEAIILETEFKQVPHHIILDTVQGMAYLLDAEKLEDHDVTDYATKFIVKGAYEVNPN